MTIAPVFLMWDDCIPNEIGQSVRDGLRQLFITNHNSRGITFHVALDYFSEDGKSLSAGHSLKEFGGDFSKVPEAGAAKGQHLEVDPFHRLGVHRRISERFDSGQREIVLPPLIVLVFARDWVPDYDVKAMVSDLFHDAKKSGLPVPRLAVFGDVPQFEWLNLLSEDTRQRKELLGTSFGVVRANIDSVIDKIDVWLGQKLEEKTVASSNPVNAPIPPVSTPPLPPVVRPTIDISAGTSVTQPQTPISEVPQMPIQPVNDQAGVVAPNIPTLEVEALPDGDGPTPVEAADHGPSSPQPIAIWKEEIDTPSERQGSKGGIREKWEKLSRKKDKTDGISRTDFIFPVGPEIEIDSVPFENNEDHIKSVIEPELQIEGTQEVDTPTNSSPVPLLEDNSNNDLSLTSDEQVSMEAPRAIDGQLLLDLKSSLNAKPWYTPNWKKLPETGPARDLELEFGSLDELRLMAGSTRGTKHEYYGDENQDAFFVARTKSKSHLVLAIADGVSSATYSAYGSKMLTFLVAREVAEVIEQKKPPQVEIPEIIEAAVRRASDRVQNWQPGELYAPSTPPGPDARHDVSATFSVAVVATQEDQDRARKVTLACVGDSPCYTLHGLDWTLRSAVTKDGELLEQATSALPVRMGEDPRLELFEFDLAKSDVLVMMTDGIGTSLASGDTPVGKWLAPRIYGPSLSQDFAGLLSTNFSEVLTYDRQGEDDDRTLVVLYDFDGVEKALQTAMNLVPNSTNQG